MMKLSTPPIATEEQGSRLSNCAFDRAGEFAQAFRAEGRKVLE